MRELHFHKINLYSPLESYMERKHSVLKLLLFGLHCRPRTLRQPFVGCLCSWITLFALSKTMWFPGTTSRGRINGPGLADGWIWLPFHSDWLQRKICVLKQPNQLLGLLLRMHVSLLCEWQARSPGVTSLLCLAQYNRTQYREADPVEVLGDLSLFGTFACVSLP